MVSSDNESGLVLLRVTVDGVLLRVTDLFPQFLTWLTWNNNLSTRPSNGDAKWSKVDKYMPGGKLVSSMRTVDTFGTQFHLHFPRYSGYAMKDFSFPNTRGNEQNGSKYKFREVWCVFDSMNLGQSLLDRPRPSTAASRLLAFTPNTTRVTLVIWQTRISTDFLEYKVRSLAIPLPLGSNCCLRCNLCSSSVCSSCDIV